MLTRCPSCGTTFRLRPEQLGQAEGRVLCGKCNSAFSAILHRIDAESAEDPVVAPLPAETDGPLPLPASATHFRGLGQRKRFVAQAEPTSGESAEPGEVDPDWVEGADALTPASDTPDEASVPNSQFIVEPASESPGESFPDLSTQPLEESDSIPDSGAFLQTPESTQSDRTESAAFGATPDEASHGAEPEVETVQGPAETVDRPEPDVDAKVSDYLANATPARAWPWAVATALLASTLLVQLGFAYRTELAKNQPAWRPALEALCERLGCTVELPRDAQRVSIESSDLNPESDKKHLQLAATLKNRADFPQSYPHLELTLTDVRNQPLVRRVFAPEDYLPKTAPPDFQPNAEVAVKLMLEIDEANASGYRVYLFYP